MFTPVIFLVMAPADWLGVVALALSVLGSLGYLIYRTSAIVTIVERMEPQVVKIAAMEVKVDEMWRLKTTISQSPMVLNDYGKKILKDSEIEKVIEQYYSEIVKKVKDLQPKNPFQAQEVLIDVVKALGNDPDCQNLLQNSAFKSGTNTETVLFVAAINIRDKVIGELGFDKDDIDKHDPKKAVK